LKSATVRPAVVPWELPPPDTLATDESYRRALSTLFAFSETARSAAEIRLARDRKLDRMRTLLGLLDSPQAHFQTILVAGTKGKGSMAAILTSILETAGIRAGRYTQPHLYSYRERTWSRGRYVEDGELVEGLRSMADALRVMEDRRSELGALTTFDVGTALSLLHFARCSVEVAVVEVGVGGANDATNALEPILTLIGPIGMDHADTLGSDLAAIAREKAGVLRSGVDCVVARQEPVVLNVIAATAARLGAPVSLLDDCVRGDSECSFSVAGRTGPLDDLAVALAGRFQRDNAAMAVIAAQLLARRGWRVAEPAIREGLASVRWPGRFQTVVHDPLTIVDGAHNPCAARALAETIRTRMPDRLLTLVLGMSQEKDVASTVRELAPLADRLIVTRARHQRSWPPAQLAEIVRSVVPTLETVIAASPGEALEMAWATHPPAGATVVTGSLFLVGDVLEWLLPAASAER
jgi:dihydrofolate synthase/folylpolyglutamate synthase